MATIVLGFTLYFNITFPMTKVFPYTADNVELIEIQSGNTGKVTTYETQEEIQSIVDYLTSMKLKHAAPRIGFGGYAFRIFITIKNADRIEFAGGTKFIYTDSFHCYHIESSLPVPFSW